MGDNLFIHLVVNISMLLLAATLLTEIRPLRAMLKQRVHSIPSQLCLGLLFGLLSITGTYTGLSFQGAVVNTRVVSTVAAGLVGGPLSGLCAGAISGIHRYLYNPEGFTSLACGVGTFFFGVIGAVSYRWFARQKQRYLSLIWLVILSELLQCSFILLLAHPFEAAVTLEKAILLPKIVVNSMGLVLFMYMLDRLNRELTIQLAEQQSLALFIAQKCLPYLREGMGNRQAMQQAMDTVRANLPDFQAIITDREQVLASSGVSLSASPLPPPAAQAVESRDLVVIRNYVRDASPASPGSAAIAAPLIWDSRVVGTLMLVVPQGPSLVLEADIRTASSLAQLFSSMLELGELQHQVELRQLAELRALQSQINPHFLFNALNTISALCLTDPDRARETILVLASYFRQTLSINESFVTLEQELSNVDNYLFLTEARFEGVVHVTKDLPANLTALRLPPLILQPIVENAVRHGGTTVDDRHVFIQIQQDEEQAHIRVSDKGHGFPPEVLKKLNDPDDPTYTGLFNVRKRLRSIYGSRCVFTIDSTEQGSTVSFTIPLVPPEEARLHVSTDSKE